MTCRKLTLRDILFIRSYSKLSYDETMATVNAKVFLTEVEWYTAVHYVKHNINTVQITPLTLFIVAGFEYTLFTRFLERLRREGLNLMQMPEMDFGLQDYSTVGDYFIDAMYYKVVAPDIDDLNWSEHLGKITLGTRIMEAYSDVIELDWAIIDNMVSYISTWGYNHTNNTMIGVSGDFASFNYPETLLVYREGNND